MNLDKYDVVVSIDIGLRGALCIFDVSEREHESHGLLIHRAMPTFELEKNDKIKDVIDVQKLAFYLESPKLHEDKALVVFEDVHAFPGQGSVSTGVLMEQKGIIRGICAANGYDTLAISPKTWQAQFGITPPKDLKGTSASKTKVLRKKWLKANSMAVAQLLFGEQVDVDNDGLSDALLIGKWALQGTAP